MINPKNLGLAGGIFCGVVMFILTVLAILTGYGATGLELVKSYYIGYSISWAGSVIGLIYGFIEGFISLYIVGWLYNKLNG